MKIKSNIFYISILLLCINTVEASEIDGGNTLGQTGVSVEYSSSKYDFNLTELSLSDPRLSLLENAKSQIVTEGEGESLGVKLDYWVRPYLNVFGSVAQTKGETSVKFSGIPGVVLSDMKVSNDGMLYNIGATTVMKDEDYFASLSYIYSVANLDNNNENTTVNTWVPTIGKVTGVGVFSLGLNYQQLNGKYSGVLEVPGLGSVDVKVSAENKEELAYVLGYQTKVAKNIYFQGSAIFGKRENYKLGLNYRF